MRLSLGRRAGVGLVSVPLCCSPVCSCPSWLPLLEPSRGGSSSAEAEALCVRCPALALCRHASKVLWAIMDAAHALLRLKPAVARVNTPPDAVNAACYFTSVFPWFCSAHAPLRLFELSGAYELAASFALVS